MCTSNMPTGFPSFIWIEAPGISMSLRSATYSWTTNGYSKWIRQRIQQMDMPQNTANGQKTTCETAHLMKDIQNKADHEVKKEHNL